MAQTVDELLEGLGRQVRALRIAADLSQRELADVVSVGEGTIVRMEAGRPVGLGAFVAVVRALDRTDWLRELDPVGQGPSPIEQLRMQRHQPARRSRVGRRRR
jgi:DNA-binding XRE family transcriptional regulator